MNEKQFQPFIAPETKMAEFTIKAVVTGSVFGIIFGAATVYLALKAGLTFPVHPTAIKTKHVPIKVAIVIPEMGLFEEPINPTILDDTVTKKAPNITTNTPSNNLLKIVSPGTCGKRVINKINARLPNPTIFSDRSLSVLFTPSPPVPSFNELILPLKEEMMVGIVFSNVIKPPAATAPAPICRTYAR